MTQIFGFACPRYVLHVSDRLLSTRLRSGVLHPADARFNKNVLFGGRGGVVSLGFSGLARIDRVPTDQWMAAVLAGERPTAPQGGPGRGIRITASSQPFPRGWPDIGRAMERLRNELESAAGRVSPADRVIGLASTRWVGSGNGSTALENSFRGCCGRSQSVSSSSHRPPRLSCTAPLAGGAGSVTAGLLQQILVGRALSRNSRKLSGGSRIWTRIWWKICFSIASERWRLIPRLVLARTT